MVRCSLSTGGPGSKGDLLCTNPDLGVGELVKISIASFVVRVL